MAARGQALRRQAALGAATQAVRVAEFVSSLLEDAAEEDDDDM